jgi:hypothetical protein
VIQKDRPKTFVDADVPYIQLSEIKVARTIEEKRESARISMAKRRVAYPEIMKAYSRNYRIEHRDELRKKEKAYRIKHREYYAALSRHYRETHLETRREYTRRYQANQRSAVFAFYGGEHPRCECCGESHLEFLTIDHVNGDGSKHRKQIGEGALYNWLIKNNFPNGFRVLCMNCNFSLGIRGYCPHNGLGE